MRVYQSISTLLTAALVTVLAASAAFADEPTGEQIYREKCASCHGENGEGTEDSYPEPLVGDRPLSDLTRVIVETMPEGEPELCVGEEAAKVAAYINDAFYSKAAQARNEPVRVELSHLTVRQYQNAVADLVGSFTGSAKHDDERGLNGEYFNDRRPRRDKRLIERRDPKIDFDFGTDGPEPEKFDPHEFSIKWEGSVLAPDTGDYEFIVRTEHALKLWVNDPETPLIDAYVKSGDDTEYRASIPLLGGRAYRLRLEFLKAKQGVNDKKNKEGPPAPASISLSWKRPNHVEEVIPERHLSPNEAPKVFVLETPFPPDDRSTGYERGSSVSKAWAEATTFAALEVAGKVADDINRLAGTRLDAEDRAEKLRSFAEKFVERATRRPLTDDLKEIFVDRQFDEAADSETAVKRVVLLTLKSPRFLYREVTTPEHDAFDVASRLSFSLWDSLPDEQLLKAAAEGKLESREQVRQQAERMVSDPRTRSKVREFFHQWLNLDRMHDLAKDGELYPDFTEEVASDLRASLDLFLDEVVWSESSDFRQLFLDDSIYVNGRLAKFYGIDLSEDANFQKVSFEPEQRAGLLTHPYLMSGFAYYGTSSPIHRGVFLARNVLGRTLMPPPEAVSPLAPDLHPDLTTRERTILQTSPSNCQTCHSMINPLGFALERFDAVGRLRFEEKGKPIDASGSYLARNESTVPFTGARELAGFLVNSEEAHEAFLEGLFAYLAKQPIQAFGQDRISELRQSFTENDYNIRKSVIEAAVVFALPSETPKE